MKINLKQYVLEEAKKAIKIEELKAEKASIESILNEESLTMEVLGDPEKLKEYDKKYYQEKRDEILKQKREYYCNHKEEKSAYGKEYRKKNKEKLKKMYSDWVKKNREHVNAYSKQYAKDNPEPSRNASRRRRARKLNCEGGITQKEWMCVLEKYENKCLCCGISENIEMDHVIPLSKRGMHTVDNVQPLCRSCNARKRDKVEDYR